MENPDNSVMADNWKELQRRGEELINKLEAGDMDATLDLLVSINRLRDQTLYFEVGKLTRALHDAITNFDIDSSAVDITGESSSQMVNAKERLDYVIKLTQKSADKTMDMVEEGIPLASQLGATARELKQDWERLSRREMQADEFRDLYQRMNAFLENVVVSAPRLEENFNNILMAQDFQDLSGQVIKKVIALVQDVESRLVELMRMAGRVEALTGIVHTTSEANVAVNGASAKSKLEGPQVKPEGRTDVASTQDDVDDLLSSLGF